MIFSKIHPRIKEIGDNLTVEHFVSKDEYFTIQKKKTKKYVPYTLDWGLMDGTSITEAYFINEQFKIYIQIFYGQVMEYGKIEKLYLAINEEYVSLTSKEHRFLKKKVKKLLREKYGTEYKDNRDLLNTKENNENK